MTAYIFSLRHKKVVAAIKKVVLKHLSYYDESLLWDFAQVAINNEKMRIEGVIIEAECGLGGSAITLAAAKSKDRIFYVYDVFSMHPSPSDDDGLDALERQKVIETGKAQGIEGDLYYGYEKNLYDKVVQSFADFGLEVEKNHIYIKKGLFEDTLKVESPVSLAHIDCDWYDSVLTCLNRIEPHLVRGGTLIVNDYWLGCRKAVHKYFEKKNSGDYSFTKKAALFIVKR